MAIADIDIPRNLVKGPPCGVCEVLDGLDDTEAGALVSLLANPKWRYSELSERLSDEGIDLASQALSRHARGKCKARTKLRGA